MNTSYTSQLRREFDNMELLSDIASPEPNFITTGPKPNRQQSLEDNPDLYSELSQQQNYKRKKTENIFGLKGMGKVWVNNTIDNKIEEVDEANLQAHHERLDQIGDIFDLAIEPDDPTVASQQQLLVDPLPAFAMAPQGKNIFIKGEVLKYLEERSKSKGFGKPKPPVPGMVWNFGNFVSNSVTSATFQLRVTEMSETFCYVCMGFGHSRHNCLTETKFKQITKKLPMSAKLSLVLNLVLQNDALVAKEYNRGINVQPGTKPMPWVLYKIVHQFAFSEINKLKEDGQDQAAELETKIYASILKNLGSISVQCMYCQGYGHSGIDTMIVKKNKGALVKTKKKGDTEGQVFKTRTNTFYDQEEVACKTKLRFESVILSEYVDRTEITGAIAEWREIFGKKKIANRPSTVQGTFAAAMTMKQNTVAGINNIIKPISEDQLKLQVQVAEQVQKAQTDAYKLAKAFQVQQAQVIQQASAQKIAANPVGFWTTDEGLPTFFEHDTLTTNVPDQSTAAKIKSMVPNYKPLKWLRSIVLIKDDNSVPDIKIKTLDTHKFPFFWFHCCPSRMDGEIANEMYRLMHLNKAVPFSESLLKKYAKLKVQASSTDSDVLEAKVAKDFRLFIFLLANSIQLKSQFLVLRTICETEEAYAQLIALILDASKSPKTLDEYTAEEHVVANITVDDVFDLFYDDTNKNLINNKKQQDTFLATHKAWSQLYNQAAFEAAITLPLSPAWLGTGIAIKNQSYVEALTTLITDKKDELKTVFNSLKKANAVALNAFKTVIKNAAKTRA